MGRLEVLQGLGLGCPHSGPSQKLCFVGAALEKGCKNTLSTLSELAVKIWLSGGLYFLSPKIHMHFLWLFPSRNQLLMNEITSEQ